MRQLSLLSIALVLFLIPLNTTHASPCTFTRLLYEGVQGIDVQCLQNFLKTKGYFTGVPTGLYGPSTKVAVSTWQHASGVIVTPKEYGLFGEQSRVLYAKQIATMPSPPTAPKTTTTTKKKKTATTSPVCVIKRTLTVKTVGTDVTCLQTYLKANGFFKGTPDGIYASSTKAAVSSFQTKNKIKVKKTDQGTFEKESLSAYKKLSKGKKAGGGGGGGGGGGSSSDTTAPTTPTSLSASAVTQTTLTLSWTASTDSGGVSGYNVYKDGSLLTSGITGTTYGVTGLTLNTAYSFTVLAYDSAGNLSTQSSALATTTLPDTTEPTTPGNATFSSVTTSAITLSWTASTDAVGVSGYRIYRGATQVGTTTLLTLTNSSLSSGTSSSYTIEAYDAAGNRSSRSATTSTSTLTVDTTAPTVPGVISFSLVTASTLRLAFASSTDAVGVSGYRIYRDGIQVGTSTFASFNDLGLVASTTYAYTVSAYDAANNISVRNATTSTTTTVATDTTAPTTPGAISFSSVSSTTITLRWASSTDAVGVSGYKVYRGGTQIATATVALYTNTGLTASTSYSYNIAGYDAAGNVSTRNATTSTSTVGSGVVISSIDVTNLNGTTGIKLNGVRGSASPGFNDRAGSRVAGIGDVNDDSRPDLLVGAQDAEFLVDSSAQNSGRTYVLYGTSTVKLTTLANGTTGFDLNLLNGTQGVTFTGPLEVNGGFSYNIAGGGDHNGDGIADLLVSQQNGSGQNSRGYVVYGDASNDFAGLDGLVASQLAGNHASGADDVNSDGADDGAVFDGLDGRYQGLAIGNAGDIDSDGRDDILVGNAERDTARGADSGEVFLVFGTTSAAFDGLASLGGSNGTNVLSFRGQMASDTAGYAVSEIGDINNDGREDFAIGATSVGYDGKFYVIFGNTRTNLSSLASSINTSGFNATLNGSNGFRSINSPFAQFANPAVGQHISPIGDFNGDLIDDFVVSAGGGGLGMAVVVFGTTTAFSSTLDLSTVMSTHVGGFAIAAGVTDIAGAGDVNGDGLADLVIGASGSNQAYILFGMSNIASLLQVPDAIGESVVDLTDNVSFSGSEVNLLPGGYLYGKGVVLNGTPGTIFGTSVSGIGDFNSDGFDDVIVGAPLATTSTSIGSPAGAAFVVYGADF